MSDTDDSDLTAPTDDMNRHREAMDKFLSEWESIGPALVSEVENNPEGILLVDGEELAGDIPDEEIEQFGRKVISKLRHDSIEHWTHAKYIVVVDENRIDLVPDDVLYQPTEQEKDAWINAFSSDFTEVGELVRERLLHPQYMYCDNLPYVVLSMS